MSGTRRMITRPLHVTSFTSLQCEFQGHRHQARVLVPDAEHRVSAGLQGADRSRIRDVGVVGVPPEMDEQLLRQADQHRIVLGRVHVVLCLTGVVVPQLA